MNSRKNHVKRVAAGALAVLTVAAYAAPVANVGGLPAASIIIANAADPAADTAGEVADAADDVVTDVQVGNGIINVNDAKDYIVDIYEVKEDATTHALTYTKQTIANNNTFIFSAEKRYVLRTTAFVKTGNILGQSRNDKLEAGVYEYVMNNIIAGQRFDVEVKTANVSLDYATESEKASTVVKQNGKTVAAITEDGNNKGKYAIVQGAPFTLTVTPSADNAAKMLAITDATV